MRHPVSGGGPSGAGVASDGGVKADQRDRVLRQCRSVRVRTYASGPRAATSLVRGQVTPTMAAEITPSFYSRAP